METVSIDNIVFDLLASRKAVYMPTIGVLSTVRIPSSVDNITGDMIAPRYIVEYVNSVEGIALTDVIGRTKEVDSDKALYIYNSWLESIVVYNENYKRYDIKGVGILTLYPEGAVSFYMYDELSDILNPLADIPQNIPTPPPLIIPPQPPVIPIINKTPLVSVEKEEYTNNGSNKSVGRNINNKKYIIWRNISIVLLILLVAVLFIFWGKPEFNYNGNIKREADTVVRIIRDTIIVPQTTDSSNRDNDIYKSINPYHIIAGSLNDKENAEKLLKKKLKEFPESVIIYDEQKQLYMVSVLSFKDKSSAQKKLNNLPILYYPNSYWIYKMP